MKHSLLFLMLLGVLPVLMGQSYQNGSYFHKIELTATQPKQPLPLPQLPKPGLIVKGASMSVRFFSKSGLAFEDNVTYNLPVSVEYSTGPSLKDTIDLSIDQDHPLMVYKMDISALLANTKIDFRALQFPNPKRLANVNPAAWDKFIRNLVVEISYQIEVGVDARQFPADSISLTIKGKKATFKWSTRGQRFPSYEFQLLKLFNDGKEITNEWDTIKIGSLDWSKALNIWTESSANSLTLTLAEGTGFYVCRVRPIGNYFDHQIANPLNYGQWSPVPLEPGLKRSKLKLPYFFFSDPDETKNYIYSRTFTEENKVNESIVFADNLLQVKQTQTFLPSKDTILVTQKIPDFSGRPAIGTLPIPVPNAEGMVYQNKFVRSNGTDLFHPRNFDTDLTLYAPDTVTSYKSPTAYYSESNPDVSIPSAEGYPFSRTIYYNEPELRVKDQSGVGKTHMIASTQADGMGHTIKTQFGVPAEEELVRIFGNEAPRASAVIKTITTDQNNISQVQYTNLNGKVIATALSIADTNQTHLKQLNHDKALAFRVKDEITSNHQGDRGVESSKRFILQRSSDLRISYIYNCSVLRDKCTDYNINCAFDLKISLVNIEDPSFKAIVIKRNLTDSCLIPNNQVTPVDTLLKFLPPGTYVINKELVPGKKTSVIATEARDRIEQQIKPLSNLISNWLSSVVCAKQLDEFYQKLDTLSKDVKQLDAATFRVKYQLPVSFVKEAAHSVIVLRQPATGKPETVLITSPCCQIEVSVVFVPPFQCPDDLNIVDKSGNDTIDVNFNYFTHPQKTEFPADFEGYAFSYLRSKGCFDEDGDGTGDSVLIRNFLYFPLDFPIFPIKVGLLQGYNPGDFNWMVYHMLADKYNANGKLYTENPPNAKPCNTTAGGANPARDCDSNGLGGADFCCEDSLCTQYRCADLFTCWKGLLDQVVYEYCRQGTQYDNINISHEVDVHEDQEDTAGKDEGNTHNEQFDKRETNFFLEVAFWFANVWGKVREAQEEGKPEMEERLTPKRHLAKQFLECTGYRFAKIITSEEALPASELNDPNSLIRKYKRNSWSGINPQGPGICSTCKTQLFPYIKDPVYAFKYFEYPKDTFPILEFTNCFEDPNICGKDAQGRPIYCCPTEKDSLCNFCGFGKIKCESTYREWSSGQRYSFYLTLEHYVDDQGNTVTSNPLPKSCNDYTAINPKTGKMYIDSILTEMTDAGIKACEMKRSIFSRVLRDTLLKKCYVIGECRSNKPEDDYIIPEKDFEEMVDAIIEQCKQQSVINTYKCDTSEQCRYITAPRNIIGYPAGNPTVALQYTSMRLGVGGLPCDQCTEIDSSGIFHCTADTLSYVDLLEYRQAKEWALELIIPSKCKNATNIPLASGTPVDCEIKSEKVSVYSPYAKPKESKGLASELIPIHVEVKNKQLP